MTRYELLQPNPYDRRSDTYQTRSGTWESIGDEFDSIDEARQAIDEMQASGWGTLAIREVGALYPDEIYKIRCLYCDREVLDHTLVPDPDDDDAWAELEHEHEDDCEWFVTRAHSRTQYRVEPAEA